VPAEACKGQRYRAWEKSFADTLYRIRRLNLLRSRVLKITSKPGEDDRSFRVRLQHAAHEARDTQAASLREKYGPKVSALQERIRKAEQALAREAEQATQSKFQTAISFGTTILGAFLGRKTISTTNVGKAATAFRSAGRTAKEAGDVTRARENVTVLQQQLAELEAQFQGELDALAGSLDPMSEAFETIEVKPKKSDIHVELVALAWAPFWTSEAAESVPAWK
jgi:hypothetical protein